MKNHLIYFLLTLLLSISKSAAKSSKAKNYIFHSFGRIKSSSQKLENFFSRTSDGELFNIHGNLDDNQTADWTMNVDISGYDFFKHQKMFQENYSYCPKKMTSKVYTFFFDVVDSESNIILYGCEVGSRDFIVVYAYERSGEISMTNSENATIISIINHANPRFFNHSTLKINYGTTVACACVVLQNAIESEALKQRSDYIVIVCFIGLSFMTYVIKIVFDWIDHAGVHPYLT